MNICNYEPIWFITWDFSIYYWLAKWTKCIFKRHLQRCHYVGYKVCTHRCECVGTKNSSITEEQVSRNLRICFNYYLVSILPTCTWEKTIYIWNWKMLISLLLIWWSVWNNYTQIKIITHNVLCHIVNSCVYYILYILILWWNGWLQVTIPCKVWENLWRQFLYRMAYIKFLKTFN